MYTHVAATSETLRTLLNDSMHRHSEFAFLGTEPASLKTPHEMLTANNQGLSVWLYRVSRDEYRLNDPPIVRRRSDGELETLPPPLPLRLHYLLTPLAEDATTKQLILGHVLQLFHTTPILSGSLLGLDLAGTEAQIHVRLEALGLEEITRVWEALEGSYQLSVSYEVSLVNIGSEAEPRPLDLVESVYSDTSVIAEAS